jgi:apolipoprotein N-acyltransferase
LRVLAIQTNLPQNNKLGWPVDRQEADVNGFLEQTFDALDMAGPMDLVVWPETMVPGLGFDPDTLAFVSSLGPRAAHLSRWPQVIRQAAAESGIPWLVGSPTWLGVSLSPEGYLESEHRYNSAVLVDPTSAVQRYDKIFLTPFGETMPWIRSWPWLESQLMAVGASGMQFDLDAGNAPMRLTIAADEREWTLAVPVCFEDAVPSVVRALAVQDGRTVVDAIVNVSNDGWFGTDDAGRRTHEVAAIYRAIELQRPMIRVANTGFTSVIAPNGTVRGRIDARIEASLPIVLPTPAETPINTTYARWGNWFPRSMLVLVLVGFILRVAGGPVGPMKRASCVTRLPV